jgi:4-hydroxybenzoate polyprenyltransferase
MSAFLTLIRFPNLLMIAFTQYTMRYAVILPLARSHSVEFQLSGFDFFCLVFSTMCTAAAGYAINDYFDVKTDKINRPGKVVVGRKISRRRTMMTHIAFCALGILLGGYVTWKTGIPGLVLVYIMVAGMLWLYSSIYKRQFLIGNIIVALFSAVVPMMVLLDIPPIYRAEGQVLLNGGANLNFAVFWILGVAVFAFLTTLSREITKDAEDFEGDAAYGCRSLPVVLGDRCTKCTVIGINIVTVAALGVVYGYFLRHVAGCFSFFYILLLLVVPVIFISWKIHKAITGDDYRRAGDRMKLVMLAGIAYSCVVWLAAG